MTFKDVAIKNFKTNIKRYFMCFLCSSFSIMILFMYSTLLFNDTFISSNLDKMGFDLLLYISMGAIIIFSIFFINYAHSSFIKSRYKEFGIMMTLGMNKRDITKLIIVEDIILVLVSLVTGIVTGALFSRLFQMVVKEILKLEDIKYILNFKSFLLTISVFIVIFLIQIIITVLSTNHFTIDELIKKNRVNEGKIKNDILPGALGIIIMVSSMVALLIIGNSEERRKNLFLVIPIIALIFIGVYIIISSMGMTMLFILKSNSKLFHRNLIVVTNLNQKFTSHKRVIFILTMLSALTAFSIVPPLALLNETHAVVDLNKYDMAVASVYGLNQVDEDKIQEIAKRNNIEINKTAKTEFMAIKFQCENGGKDMTSSKMVVSESQYNLVSDYKIKVEQLESIAFITGWLPDNGGVEAGQKIKLINLIGEEQFNIKDLVREHWIFNDSIFPSYSAIVLNDMDYSRLKLSAEEGSIGYCYQWDLSDWVNKDSFSNEVRGSLINEPKVGGEEYRDFNGKYFFMAKPLLYSDMKEGYKFFVFITTIMGILFFMSSASVLFFNHYIELEANKKKFSKLYKIGITKKEIRDILSKELLVTFFTPVIFGSIVAIVLMNYVAKVMGGKDMINEFMRSSLKVIVAYLIFQGIVYLFTRRNHISKLEN